MYKNSYDYLIFLNSLDKSKNYWFVQSSVKFPNTEDVRPLDKNKNYWFAQSSVKFPNTEDVRSVIEFFGQDKEKFIRYNKGKTDLFYVGK